MNSRHVSFMDQLIASHVWIRMIEIHADTSEAVGQHLFAYCLIIARLFSSTISPRTDDCRLFNEHGSVIWQAYCCHPLIVSKIDARYDSSDHPSPRYWVNSTSESICITTCAEGIWVRNILDVSDDNCWNCGTFKTSFSYHLTNMTQQPKSNNKLGEDRQWEIYWQLAIIVLFSINNDK